MAKAMHDVVLHATKDVVQKSKYILMNYDEFTTIDNQIWVSIHVYLMEE
jgi:hypothetical protein